MKKIIWIYSVNTNGKLLGEGGSTLIWNRSPKFQDKMRAEFLPEWEVTFISYDISNDNVPSGDLILYNQIDAPYISDELKEIAFAVPYIDIETENIKKIKQELVAFVEKR